MQDSDENQPVSVKLAAEKLPDWEDLRKLALVSPHVHHALHLLDQGLVSRETALILAVMALYEALDDTHKWLLRILAGTPIRDRE